MICISLSRKEIDKRFYERRKANGQCVNCGKEMERDGVLCVDCLAKANKQNKIPPNNQQVPSAVVSLT